ncbi:MAG: glycoside hydrolase family 9 protein, partial [Eubacterium sp.]|nr:glycoside hydrolase family 9 protein [Eubacterium sp.]
MEVLHLFNSIKKGLSIALAGVLAVSTISVSSYETQAAEVGEYNYAKLLQESLYFYDANMCGKDVGERSAFSWRDDCHTSDSVVIDGQTIDVSGGFHDAGDHGKFGLPQAYSATMLGISYYEFKDAYIYADASEHLKTITNHFCEYFERCTVLNTDGSVKCFIYQVGDYNDHKYWGAPENQTGSRPVFCTSDSNTATDEVSEAASALTLQYLNFGDSTALSYAQKLFAYAKSHNKACATEGLWDPATGGYLYNSTSWGDDYALAAALLFKATNDQSYKTEFNNVKNQ